MSAAASPVYGIRKEASMVDFPGRLAAVLFTSGCNFRCGFCHNTALLQGAKSGYTWEKLGEICERFRQGWVDGVVITGGEPTLAADLLPLLDFVRRFGFAVKLDSNGSRPEVLDQALPLLDYVAMDVKCSLQNYPTLTGFNDAGQIARSAELLRTRARDYEFRTTVIERLHSDEEMRMIGALIRCARRYVLQPFLPREDLPDPTLRTEPRTSPDRLKYLAAFMREYTDEIIVRGA